MQYPLQDSLAFLVKINYVKWHYFKGLSNELAKVSVTIIRTLLTTLATVALPGILNTYMRLDFSISLTLCTLLFLFFRTVFSLALVVPV